MNCTQCLHALRHRNPTRWPSHLVSGTPTSSQAPPPRLRYHNPTRWYPTQPPQPHPTAPPPPSPSHRSVLHGTPLRCENGPAHCALAEPTSTPQADAVVVSSTIDVLLTAFAASSGGTGAGGVGLSSDRPGGVGCSGSGSGSNQAVTAREVQRSVDPSENRRCARLVLVGLGGCTHRVVHVSVLQEFSPGLHVG